MSVRKVDNDLYSRSGDIERIVYNVTDPIICGDRRMLCFSYAESPIL
jgi:hypothetical protein